MGKKNSEKKVAKTTKAATRKISEEVIAVIAMAIHEYQEDVHDKETNVLTINQKIQDNSPWGLKVLTLRHIPTLNK
ncbi:MAG: OadG family protein [Bacteroidaceae bacterium]|nr:OadG family protein [Bacteroidaceae bacterium]